MINTAKKLMDALAAQARARQEYSDACKADSDLETQVLDEIRTVRNKWADQRDKAQRKRSNSDAACKLAKTRVTFALSAYEQALMETM